MTVSLVLKILWTWVVLVVLLIFFAEWRTLAVSRDYIYDDVQTIPNQKVWLVLWTSKYISDGRDNLFYTYRINAIEELYTSWKIQYIIVSGDNATAQYNETDTMKRDLIDFWIPEERIYGDYAGFRTLDSIVRAEDIFSQSSFIVVSQKFHLERAIYIAQSKWLEVYGYAAKDVPVSRSPRVWIRERLARVKMLLDNLLWVDPKFSGDKIEIGD
jgi:SanA protein